jgi:hypothetical protein
VQREAKRNILPGLKLSRPAQQAKIAKIAFQSFSEEIRREIQ